jgi:uncharacterized UPF0146 family protein
MKVRYDHFSKAWIQYSEDLQKLASFSTVKKICEVGGGANPALPLDFVEKHGLEYTILDISMEELEKAPDGYYKLRADIASPTFSSHEQYDLVFSMQLAEHVKSGQTFHRNVSDLLREGGYAFHLFPTLYAIPFIANRLLPQTLSDRLLLWHSPSRQKEGNRGKFPAYYSWCKGPLRSQIKDFENLGYKVEEYVGFFGHDYYTKYKPLKSLSNIAASMLLDHPIPMLTTYTYVLLSKQHHEI